MGVRVLIRIDPTSERAIYAQLADSIRAAIASGAVGVGDTLPAAKQLASALDVHQHTILRAYQLLRDERVVDLRRGRGAVVTDAATVMVELYREAKQLAARAERLGLGPDTVAALVAHAIPHDSLRDHAVALADEADERGVDA